MKIMLYSQKDKSNHGGSSFMVVFYCYYEFMQHGMRQVVYA